MKELFNHTKYEADQLAMALLCPINRDAVRRKFGCDDRGLIDHVDDLLMTFVENGGAEEFAKRREEYKSVVYDEDDIEYMI